MKNLNNFKSNRGITLIALIITIIVMLILVAVSIRIAIQTGLFDSAGKATQKTRMEVEKEKELANLPDNPTVDNLINKYTSGETKQPKIGDYVNYEPEIGNCKVNTDESGHSEVQNFKTQTGTNKLRWRIMSLGDENGNILLVADRPTTDKLTLNGGVGYTHSTELIERICSELYDNQDLGITARSYNYFNNVYSDIWEISEVYATNGDRFLYLTNDTIWIPVGHSNSDSWGGFRYCRVLSYNVAEGYIENLLADAGEHSKSYPLLPVVIIPQGFGFSYAWTDTMEEGSEYNVWNIEKYTDGMYIYDDPEKTKLIGICQEHLVKDTEVIANNLPTGIKVASLKPIKLASGNYHGDYYKIVVDGDEVTKLTIPEGVVEIDDCVFQGILVNEIVLPSTLEKIGYGAFYACIRLEKMVIPSNVTTVSSDIIGCNTGVVTVPFKEGEKPEGWNNYWSSGFAGDIQYAE